jgi:8-oxo-dGTP diphosphatase
MMNVLTVRLALIDNNSALFLSQTNKHGGRYTLVGGKIEAQEFAKEALIREVFEEIGVKIQPKHLHLVHLVHKKKKSDTTNTELILVFRAAQWSGAPKVKETKKFSAVSWLPLDDLPLNLSATTTHIMKQIQANNLYSELTPASSGLFDFLF